MKKELIPHIDLITLHPLSLGSFVSSQLTYADIAVFNILNYAWFVPGKPVVPEELQGFPVLAGHYERIMEIPAIKKWLEERPVTHI